MDTTTGTTKKVRTQSWSGGWWQFVAAEMSSLIRVTLAPRVRFIRVILNFFDYPDLGEIVADVPFLARRRAAKYHLLQFSRVHIHNQLVLSLWLTNMDIESFGFVISEGVRMAIDRLYRYLNDEDPVFGYYETQVVPEFTPCVTLDSGIVPDGLLSLPVLFSFDGYSDAIMQRCEREIAYMLNTVPFELLEQIRDFRFTVETHDAGRFVVLASPVPALIESQSDDSATQLFDAIGDPYHPDQFVGDLDIDNELDIEEVFREPQLRLQTGLSNVGSTYFLIEQQLQKLSVNMPMLVQLSALFVSLRETSSWVGAAASVTQFVLAMFSGSVMRELALIAIQEMSIFQNLVSQQASKFSESVGMVWDMLHDDAFRVTPLYTAFWNVMSALSVGIPLTMLGICPDMHTWKVYTEQLAPFVNVPANEFGLRLVAFVQAAGNSLYGFIRTRDPTLLFGGANHTGWLRYANALACDSVGVDDKGRRVTLFTTEERINLLSQAITNGEKLVSRMEHFRQSPTSITSVQVQLASLRAVLVTVTQFQKNNTARVPPFSLMFTGPPGIGKSEIVKQINASLMHSIEFPTSPNNIFAIRSGMKHMDGLSETHTAVVFDDPDKNPASPSPDCMMHPGLVIQICNGAPTVAPMAGLEQKGRIFYKFLACYYSTNLELCNLAGKITDPAPFWRRFEFRLRMSLKPQFMKHPKHNQTLDPDKARGHVNLWEFEVQSYRTMADPHTFAEAHMGTDFITDDFPALLLFLNNRFLAHYKRENARLEEDTEMSFCDKCGVLKRYHGAECPRDEFMKLKEQLAIREPVLRIADSFVQEPRWKKAVISWYSVLTCLSLVFGISYPDMAFYTWFVVVGSLLVMIVSRLFTASRIRSTTRRVYLIWYTLRFTLSHPRAVFDLMQYYLRSRSIDVMEEREITNAVSRLERRLRQQTALFTGLATGCTILMSIVLLFGKRALTKATAKADAEEKRAGKWESVVTGSAPVGATPETLIVADVPPRLVNMGAKSIWAQPLPGKFARHPLPSKTDVPTLASTTITFDALCDVVARNVAIITIGKCEFRALRFVDNFFIFPGHAMVGDEVTVIFTMAEKDNSVEAVKARVRAGTAGKQVVRRGKEFALVPGKDLAVVWLSAAHPLGASASKHVADTSQFGMQHQFDRANLVFRSDEGSLELFPCRVGVTQTGGVAMNGNVVPIRRLYSYPAADVSTEDGWCGTPLVVKRGASAWVAGMHVSAFVGVEGHSDELCATEIIAIIENIRLGSPMAVSFAELDLSQGTGLATQVGPLHEKSMMNGVATLNCEILGSLELLGPKKVFRAHEKSHVKATRFAEDFDDLRKELLGNERFVPPHSNGVEVDGVFKQPYFNAIRQLETAQNSNPRELEAAFADYLDGVEDLPGIETFHVLSIEEAIFGIAGSSIGPFDLNTSMGYPFFKKKRFFVDQGKLSLGDMSYMDPIVWKQLDWAVGSIKSGKAVVPIVSWTLKDEAIKESKDALRGQRVFNSLPFYYNILLKQYFGPIMAFMGLHKQFFECYAGMNLASSDATFFMRHMTFFGDANCIDGDMRWCDKGVDNVMMIWIGNVLMAIARILSYTPEQIEFCARLFAGLMYMCVFIKGDLMLLVHSNPSGSLLTVLINSLYLSGEYRVVWQRGLREFRSPLTLPFRIYVHLATLGDDNLANRSSMAPWFTFSYLAKVFLSEGKYLVPADKTDKEDYDVKRFDQCSFLKRRFRWSDDLKNVVAILEQVSIVKMLTTRGHSAVSVNDQEAGILASASLEFFLRGRVQYETFAQRAVAVCEKYGIGTWWLHDYDYHLRNYGEDHFQTWIN